jgi:prevent-host-death family protein
MAISSRRRIITDRPLWYFVATMPERMGVRELRDSVTSTIRRVRAGETIEVTHHGVPVAVLAPVPGDRIGRLVAAGDVTPGKPLTRPLRRSPVVGAITASQAIEDDRAES